MRKRDLKMYVFLALFGIVVLGGMGAVAYYGEETAVFFQGGWNRPAITRVAREFIARIQKKDYEGALSLCAPDRFRPIREGGQLVGVEKVDPSGMNPDAWRFAEMFPPEEPKVTSVTWSNVDGGSFIVNLRFPGGVETRFLVQKVGGPFKIIAYLGSTM